MGLIKKQMGVTTPKEEVDAWLSSQPAKSIYIGKYTSYDNNFKIRVEGEPGLILQNLAYHNTNGNLIKWIIFDFSIYKIVEFRFFPLFKPIFKKYNILTPQDWETHLCQLDKYLCGLEKVYISYKSDTFPRLNTMCFERLGPDHWSINKKLSISYNET